MAYRFFGEFSVFDFAMFSPSILFSEPVHAIYNVLPSIMFIEPGSSDLICPPSIVFGEPVRLIYYVYHSIVLSDPGSSDSLCFIPESFLAKSVRLIYYVLALNLFKRTRLIRCTMAPILGDG